MQEKLNKSLTELEDCELVILFQSGNTQAMDELYRRYRNSIMCYCLKMLDNKVYAEDLTQEIFIKVFKYLKGFKRKSKFSTWLYKIAHNSCTNHNKSLMSRMKELFVSLYKPVEPEEKICLIEKLPLEFPTALKIIQDKELEKQILEAIASLNIKKRTVIILSFIEGFILQEIADITGYNINSIKSLKRRGLKELQKKLRGKLI